MESHKCCGGIIFGKENDQIKFLIVKHKEKGGGHWDFPKGHVEKGETEEETASREIYEEVGLKVKFQNNFRESISYVDYINNVNKTVVFFLCEAVSSEVKYIFDELEDHQWLCFEDAINKLAYDNAKNLLIKANSFLETISLKPTKI